MMELPNNIVLGGLATCAAGLVSLGLFYTLWRRDRRKYAPVGIVSQIFVHPVKSCRGWEVNQSECMTMGIGSQGIMDRSFMVIDSSDTFVHARRFPSLAVVAPSLSDDKQNLLLNAPGMPTLTVPMKGRNGDLVNTRVWRLPAQGIDCGSEVAEWFSQYLGTPGFRLIRFDSGHAIRIIKDDSKWGSKAKSHEKCTYPDLAQVNIIGEASLGDLNSRLEKPVQMRNFRPNIVVNTTEPFVEDRWKYVRIGNKVTLRMTHMCARCRLTTVDPDKGEFIPNGDPLKTLKEFRMPSPDDPDCDRYGPSPLFGTNLAVEKMGTINVGDVVYAAVE